RSKSLKLVDGHWSNFKKRTSEKVLDTLLCRSQLLPQEPVACGVLHGTLSKELEQGTPGPGDGRTYRRHDIVGLLHGRRGGDLVGGGCVDVEEVGLDAAGVHRLGCASGHDEVLLRGESLLDHLVDVAPAVTVLIGLVDRSLDEVPPTEDLFGPQLEGRQEMEIASVSQSQLILAEGDESIDCLVVVVDVWVGDERVDTIHLHCDLTIYRNVSAEHSIPELTVIDWCRSVRQRHSRPSSLSTLLGLLLCLVGQDFRELA